jgi:translation initiation factor IF-3
LNLRINKQIRALKVRVIGADGTQVGVLSIREALSLAEEAALDLVEIAPNADPPVCKIIDYGKYRYEQTKREKESKKSQHQIKVKEIKLKPNIDEHDFLTKQKQARQFLEKGNKVKVTCSFRGREMAYPELGDRVVKKMCEGLEDIAQAEAPVKLFGRSLIVILAPAPQKGKKIAPEKQGNYNA